MTRDATRQLSLAASSQKIAFAFFIGREVVDWGVARKASKSIDGAFARTVHWVNYYAPARVFIEAIDDRSRKGRYAISLINAFDAACQDRGVTVIAVPRRTHYKNKYIEAAALADRHPHLRPFVPRPRAFWMVEPHRMAIFEAVALVEGWYAVQGQDQPQSQQSVAG